MANAEEKAADKLKEITECPICMSTFTDPRILPCIHTFCLNCLIRTGEASQKKPGDKMPCPLCRKKFSVPNEGMIGVQKNFFMENLIDFKTNLERGSDHVCCEMCEIRSEATTENKSSAKMTCLECLENYCESCAKVHQKQKVGINHRIVIIGKDTKKEIKRLISVTTCMKHTQKPLDYYCGDCKIVVCVSCFVESHKLHHCKDVATVDEEFRERIKEHLWKESIFADELLSLRKKKEKKKADFLKDTLEKVNAINKRNQQLKQMIDEHTKSLLGELSEVKSNHLKEIEIEMEEIDRCLGILRSFDTYCTQLRLKASPCDICRSVDKLTARADELEKDHEEFIGRPSQSVEVSFHATDLIEDLEKSKRNVVGQIEVKRETIAQLENIAIVVGLNDGATIKRDVVQLNLHRPNNVSYLQQTATTIQMEAAAAVYCNTMYVTGIGANKDEIWKYNEASGWTKCASLVQSRRRHSAAFINQLLYICGGYVDSGGSVLESVEAYNAVTNKCFTVGKLFQCVHSSGNCVPFDSSLYIFGGRDKDDKALNCVQVYDTKLNTCSLLSKTMPCSYILMQAVLWETSAILVGRNTCFIFNFETEAWQERKQFKTDVAHFGLVLENERLFVIGGGNDEKDKDGKTVWKRRDDVRYVPLRNFIDDKPIEWKIHATLAQASLIHAYGKLTSVVS